MSERTIRVWDLPTRLFHWLLFVLMVAAIVAAKIGGNAMEWHGRLGHLIFGLIVFRLVWGVVGSTTARFTHFVRGPGAIRAYLQGRWRGIGHNPLGALSVLALLALTGFQATTGLFANDDIAFRGPLAALVSTDVSNLLSDWHRQAEWFIYGLVGLHVAAVLYYAHVRGDNLVKPMVVGRKAVTDPALESARGGGLIAFAAAVVIAGAALWATSGALVPPPPPPPPALGW
nr:cytochrome b/b6 domain-containing protein [Zoogloeaceae bacterium]